jgi:hypothetical protein
VLPTESAVGTGIDALVAQIKRRIHLHDAAKSLHGDPVRGLRHGLEEFICRDRRQQRCDARQPRSRAIDRGYDIGSFAAKATLTPPW